MAATRAKQMQTIERPPKPPFMIPLIVRLAEQIGARVLVEPVYGFVGHITFQNGKTSFFRNTKFNINQIGSTEIAKDKGYAAFFLQQFGFPVPEGQTFFSKSLCQRVSEPRDIDDAFLYARALGFPVVVKPNNRSQGILVTKVHNKRDFYKTARAIFRISAVMLVQRFYAGNDYRVVVFDGRVVAAYQRVPLTITGDGESTIEELLLRRNEEFLALGRDVSIDLDDFRIKLKLGRQKLRLDSVPAAGQQVALLDNANLSNGGVAVDVTDAIHPDWADVAVSVTRAMGLRLCGVDILASDLTGPRSEYVIIEINASPGLDNFASIGAKQMGVVEGLYTSILRALERA